MSEHLTESSAQPPELPGQIEPAVSEAESSVNSIKIDPAEFVRQGVMYSMEHGGLDRKTGYQMLANSPHQSKK